MSGADVAVNLVRHGRTALNAAGVLPGRLDPPLDPTGLAEAVRLGAWFSDTGVVAVVTRPLLRARQTAVAIAEPAGVLMEVDDGLVDRDYGEWAGAARGDIERRFGSLDAAPGVEPPGAFAARVAPAFVAAADRWAPGPLVIVAHDAVNRVVLAGLTGSRRRRRDIAAHRLLESPGPRRRPLVGADRRCCT